MPNEFMCPDCQRTASEGHLLSCPRLQLDWKPMPLPPTAESQRLGPYWQQPIVRSFAEALGFDPDTGEKIRFSERKMFTPRDMDAQVKPLMAEIARMREELLVSDQMLNERDLLLGMFDCPTHGRCVPFAIDEVKRLRALAVENHSACDAVGKPSNHTDRQRA